MPGSSATDAPPAIECDLPLGRPGLVIHDELRVSGWAASPNGVTGVVVNVNDRMWTAGYGLDATSASERMPGVEDAGRSGYRLAIDTSAWEPGRRYVAVAAYDPDGRRAAVEGEVEVRPLTAPAPPSTDGAPAQGRATLELDSPAIEDGRATVEGPLEVRGWAHAAAGIEAVLVTIDGTVQHEALRPIARPDLLDRLGSEAAAGAGFALRIDPVDLPPGKHTLAVAALGPDGSATGIECELTCLGQRAGGPPATQLEAPRDEPSDDEPQWEDRARLAEADAALCRAEARLAISGQERALRTLREAEEHPDSPAGRLRSELGAARRKLAELHDSGQAQRERAAEEAEERDRELAAARGELASVRGELEAARADLTRHAVLLEDVERSASWRLTRPLRAVKRLFGRKS